MSAKLSRFANITGCVVGATTMILSLVVYVLTAGLPPDSSSGDTPAMIVSIGLMACLLCVAWGRSRARSWSEAVFHGGGLRPAGGNLWRSLRILLWVSFATILLHGLWLSQLPMPQRKDSPQWMLLLAAFTFYYGGIVLFANLYGIHALAFVRFLHDHSLLRHVIARRLRGKDWAEQLRQAQNRPVYLIGGKAGQRIRYGAEQGNFDAHLAACVRCGAAKGALHRIGCMNEQCPHCREYAASCHCLDPENFEEDEK